MTKRYALKGKPYARNLHVRLDEVSRVDDAPAATSRGGTLLYVRKTVLLVCVLLSGSVFASREVKVSDFGFDPKDSTEFICQALASGAKKVILDKQSGPWYTLPLKMPSNIEFVLESGVELVAKRGDFHGKRDYLMELNCVSNVTLRGGEGSAFRMWKCDYQKPPYIHSEWRYALRIVKSRNILVEDLKFLQSGGDGIGVSGDGITIRRCVCDGNHRQGMSVFSVNNLLVEDTVFSNTSGTAPQAGLDIEPDSAEKSLRNIVFRNCSSIGNAGPGFDMYLVNLDRKSGPVDITFENCISRNNSRDTALTCDNKKGRGHVTGHIRYVNCSFGPSRKACVVIPAKPSDRMKISFANTVLTNTSANAAVKINVSDPRYGRPDGIDFGNLTVFCSGDWFNCRAAASGSIKDMKGDVTVVSPDGSRRREKINDAWIEHHLPLFDGGRPVPDPVKIPSAASVKIHDECPGKLVETEPFTLLYQTPLMFFAEKPGPCRFVARQVNMVPGRKLSKKPLTIVPMRGGKGVKIPAPGDKSEEIVFQAKRRGFYRMLLPKWGTRLRVERTDVPIAIDALSGKATVAPMDKKPFSLSFAAFGTPFTMLAQGSDFYRFKIAVTDVEGKLRESTEAVNGQFFAHEGKEDAPGFRKVTFGRSGEFAYDHIVLRLFGGGGFFFLSEKKRWH